MSRQDATGGGNEGTRTFEAIVENAPDVITRTGPDLRIRYANLAIEAVTGLSREAAIGRTMHELGFPHPAADQCERSHRDVLETGREVHTELEVETPTGARIYSLRLVPEHGPDGSVESVLGVARDVTDQKRAEAERLAMERRLMSRQRLESLGMLAGGIAHDFNNLLTTILGTASVVRSGMPPQATQREELLQIENACMTASDLCRQLLTYAGQKSTTAELLDVDGVVDETLQLLRISLSKKIAIATDLRRGLPPVRGDQSQLRQVVMNLVINAAEAIGDRRGAIRVTTDLVPGGFTCGETTCFAPEQGGSDLVRVRVTDDGCGMDEPTRARIFEPFFSTKFTGRGLGLASTLGIVRGHGGGLCVRSEPGSGTTFTVLLPATEGRPSRPFVPVSGAQWRAEGTVLVVDDQDGVRHAAARMVEELGLRTVLARDGLEAIELFDLHEGRFDAVLLDLTMPRLDGAETLGKLRERAPDLPVILMSGYSAADLGALALEHMTAFLPKPFRADDLASVLRKALRS